MDMRHSPVLHCQATTRDNSLCTPPGTYRPTGKHASPTMLSSSCFSPQPHGASGQELGLHAHQDPPCSLAPIPPICLDNSPLFCITHLQMIYALCFFVQFAKELQVALVVTADLPGWLPFFFTSPPVITLGNFKSTCMVLEHSIFGILVSQTFPAILFHSSIGMVIFRLAITVTLALP